MTRQFVGAVTLLLSVVCLSAGCSRDDAPKGGLVAVIESDLSVPKDLDHVSFRAKQNDRTQATEERDFANGDYALPQVFPLSLTGSGDVTLIAIGSKDGIPRAQRTAIVKVPTSYVGMVRMPLDFLCEHMVTADGGSSCGVDNTCIQGLCGPARLPDVPRNDQTVEMKTSPVTGFDGGEGFCFDALSCFDSSQTVDIDRATCTFDLETDPDTSSSLNVALKLPPLSAGACNNDHCLVVLAPGDSEGWAIRDANRVALSPGICQALDSVGFSVLLSRQCPTRVRSTIPCAAASITYRDDIGTPPPLQGDACGGAGTADCGKCGLRERHCNNGRWSDWGECLGARDCEAGTERECESQGKQLCGADCTWGECLGKQCPAGPRARSCGRCGIQSRNCHEGVWSEWTKCAENGDCMPDESRKCGSDGTQVCNGICQWGACEHQACPGASSMTCGQCGERTRTCNPSTGLWSAWSECTGEGVCKPDASRECQNAGSDTCGGDCQWENVCRGQECTGRPTQSCPMCGTQSRTCDAESGQWGEFGECAEQGDCTPNATRGCQNMGTERCGTDCHWSGRCEGQRCVGESTRDCDPCGTQSRTCNADTGQWNAWGACIQPQGACTPGDTSACGTRGTRTCRTDCSWEQVCMNQQCSGTAPTRDCGCRPGTHGECNPLTGQFGNAPACSTEPCNCTGTAPTQQCIGCHPDTTAKCNTATGQWSDPPACMTGPCACMGPAPTDDCGCHGKQERTCNMVTGTWEARACPTGPCGCVDAQKPTSVTCCGGTTKSAQCDGGTGRWIAPTCDTPVGMCVCDSATRTRTTCCGVVVNAECNRNTGLWTPPVCATPPGKCLCDDTKKPKDLPCCNSVKIAACDPSDGHWIAPTCPSPCTCEDAPRPTPAPCLCQKDPPATTCNPKTGEWMIASCPAVACTPKTKQNCDGEFGEGSQVCTDSCTWTECLPACLGDPDTSCGPCGLGFQAYQCDEMAGRWVTLGVCEVPPDVCDAAVNKPRSCIANDRNGVQACSSSTCAWEACKVECRGEPEGTSCGTCGLGSYGVTCDFSTGRWIVDQTCVVPSTVCDPDPDHNPQTSPPVQACDFSGRPGFQVCGAGCQWEACRPDIVIR